MDDKNYLKKEFVSTDTFGKAMDSIGERFDQNESAIGQLDSKMNANHTETIALLTDIVQRLQKMEEDHGTLIEHGKRLDRVDKKLGFSPLAAFKFQ